MQKTLIPQRPSENDCFAACGLLTAYSTGRQWGRTTATCTRSSPQWRPGRSTTPHDVLNLWSPIYDLSVFGMWGSGWAHSVSRPCIPISSPLTHMVYLLPFSSYLAGSKSFPARPSVRPSDRPSDPATMKNTALEATTLSSDKKWKWHN